MTLAQSDPSTEPARQRTLRNKETPPSHLVSSRSRTLEPLIPQKTKSGLREDNCATNKPASLLNASLSQKSRSSPSSAKRLSALLPPESVQRAPTSEGIEIRSPLPERTTAEALPQGSSNTGLNIERISSHPTLRSSVTPTDHPTLRSSVAPTDHSRTRTKSCSARLVREVGKDVLHRDSILRVDKKDTTLRFPTESGDTTVDEKIILFSMCALSLLIACSFMLPIL